MLYPRRTLEEALVADVLSQEDESTEPRYQLKKSSEISKKILNFHDITEANR